MVSCKRAKHGCIRKIGILTFLFYQVTLFALQFFIVGAMFAAIYAFFNQVFASIFATNVHFQQLYYGGALMNAFVYVYIMLLAMCLIISLALPLDRAKPCFVIALTIFGAITIMAIVGMVFYLSAAGFYPEHMIRNPGTWIWEGQGDHHFSWLVLAGVIMLAIYVVPFLLRPVDFLENFKGYTVGLISYLILIPMFTNIFSIYSMANLHDISWGNRPTTASSGTEAFSAKADVQKETQINYKAYRANFLFLWFCANGLYFVVVLELGQSGDQDEVNDGTFTVLDGFSMYLAGVVIFRVIFATLYVIKWQIRYNFNQKYKITDNLLESYWNELKKAKKNKSDLAQESTDDQEDLAWLEQQALKREKTMKKRLKRVGRTRRNNRVTKREMIEEAKRMQIEEDMNTNMDDSDDDRNDFMDAKAEEATSHLLMSYRHKSRPLKIQEVHHISQGLADNIKGSVLSHVMREEDHQMLEMMSQHSGFGEQNKKSDIIQSVAHQRQNSDYSFVSQTHNTNKKDNMASS